MFAVRERHSGRVIAAAGLILLLIPHLAAQAGRGGGGGGAYPQRPPGDPAMVARDKALYDVNCAQCHGSDARGEDTGPNLIRSPLLLNDKDGELIAPVLQNGRLP